jgi:hypothetical protein
MTELIDYELRPRGSVTPPPPPPRPVALWIGGAVLVIALGAVAYWFFGRGPSAAPSNAAPAAGAGDADSTHGRGGLNITQPPL